MVQDRAASAEDTEHASEEGRGRVLPGCQRFVAVPGHDRGEVVRAAQGIAALGYAVLNPRSPVLADRGGQPRRQAELGGVAVDAGHAVGLRNGQPAMRAGLDMSLAKQAGEGKGAVTIASGNAENVLVTMKGADLPEDCHGDAPPDETVDDCHRQMPKRTLCRIQRALCRGQLSL